MKNHETTLKNQGNQQVLIFRDKQTELHHNIYIIIMITIINDQDDPYWWQARRECDRTMRAGLIPSR